MQHELTYIYGKHAVREALVARPDVVRSVHLADSFLDNEILARLKKEKTPIHSFTPKKMPRGVDADVVHQGIVAEINESKLTRDYDDFMRTSVVTNDTAIAILGEVQDPHNVGAVIRSAAAFGIAAICIPEHRQAQVTGTVIKVSAGMAFHLPLVRIGNVNNTIADLKERGFWVYGLDGEATQSVVDERFEKPSVFVLGNEGDGIRQKTLEHCDIPLRIPMHAHTESLNASAAAAVVFYAWSARHPNAISNKNRG